MNFKNIISLETKMLLRNRWLLLGLVLFTLIAWWSFENGARIYTYQQAGADSVATINAKNFASVKAQLDTLDYSKNLREDIETPFTLDWRLKPIVKRELNPLSALTVGQNDLQIMQKSARLTQPVFNNDFGEFKNPEQLQAGTFDISFYLLFLFPLLFMALCHNLRSSEVESGIWPIWRMAAGNRSESLQWLRLAFRWLVALVPFLVVMLYALFWLQSKQGFVASTFTAWLGITLLYALLWFGLAGLVLWFKKSSMQNLLSLLGIWVLLLVAIPGTINLFIHQDNPDSIRLDVAEFRDVPEDAWEAPMEVHKRLFAKRYPEGPKDTGTMAEIIIKTYGYLAQVMDAEQKLHERFSTDINRQVTKENSTFIIHPAGWVMRRLAILAQSNQQQQLAFEKQLIDYRTKRFYHLMDNLVKDDHFRPKDLETMPQWQP
jgi:ABC-2 type transport system permease protein